jgi:hypothetical protein
MKYNGMNVIADDTMGDNEVKVMTPQELLSLSKRNRLSGDVARNPGKTFHYRYDLEQERVKHLKLTDATLDTRTIDTFLRNMLWHPNRMRWIPTTSLDQLDFSDRVYIGAVAEISEIKRFKVKPNITGNEPPLVA